MAQCFSLDNAAPAKIVAQNDRFAPPKDTPRQIIDFWVYFKRAEVSLFG